jgi:hypothetical protein
MIPNRLIAVLPLPTDLILLCMCSLAVAVGLGQAPQFVGLAAAHPVEDEEEGEEEGWRGRERPPSKSQRIRPGDIWKPAYLRAPRPAAEGGEVFLYMEGGKGGSNQTVDWKG